MIIVEGAEKSGKTTLSKYISAFLDIPIYYLSKPPRTQEDVKKEVQFAIDTHNDHVFNGCPLIADLVHSLVKLDKKDFTTIHLEEYKKLFGLYPCIIYCRPSHSYQKSLDNYDTHLTYDKVFETLPNFKYDHSDQAKRDLDVRLDAYKNEKSATGLQKADGTT